MPKPPPCHHQFGRTATASVPSVTHRASATTHPTTVRQYAAAIPPSPHQQQVAVVPAALSSTLSSLQQLEQPSQPGLSTLASCAQPRAALQQRQPGEGTDCITISAAATAATAATSSGTPTPSPTVSATSTTIPATADNEQQTPSAEPAAMPICMDVTRSNFAEALPVVAQALQDCAFYAIDCEMTGLHADVHCVDEHLDTYEDRYRKMQTSAQQFLVCQFGLSTFTWRGSYYESRSFNFYVFPAPTQSFDRRFSCQASSLLFLASHGFDFNKFIYSGIPYIPLVLKDKARAPSTTSLPMARTAAAAASAAAAPAALRSGSATLAVRTAGELRASSSNSHGHDDDAASLASTDTDATAADLDDDLDNDGSSSDGEASVSSASCGGSPRAAPLPHVASSTSSRSSSSSSSSSSAPSPTPSSHAADLSLGFSHVLELLTSSGKPCCGHNMSLDLAHVLQQFVEPLPRSWPAYKALACRTFPGGLYDTKFIASQVFSKGPEAHQSLAGLYQTMEVVAAGAPTVVLAPAGNGYLPAPSQAPRSGVPGMRAHEAGCDAFMTGVVFARLMGISELHALAAKHAAATMAAHQAAAQAAAAGCSPQDGAAAAAAATAASIAAAVAADITTCAELPGGPQRGMAHVLPHRGKLYMGRSDLPYVDLVSADPLPSRPFVYHLSGIKPGTKTGEMTALLSKLDRTGPVRVHMLQASQQQQAGQQARGGAGRGARPTVEALAEIPGSTLAAVTADVRQLRPEWRVLSYAAYHSRQRQAQAGGSGGREGAEVRLPPQPLPQQQSPPAPASNPAARRGSSPVRSTASEPASSVPRSASEALQQQPSSTQAAAAPAPTAAPAPPPGHQVQSRKQQQQASKEHKRSGEDNAAAMSRTTDEVADSSRLDQVCCGASSSMPGSSSNSRSSQPWPSQTGHGSGCAPAAARVAPLSSAGAASGHSAEQQQRRAVGHDGAGASKAAWPAHSPSSARRDRPTGELLLPSPVRSNLVVA